VKDNFLLYFANVVAWKWWFVLTMMRFKGVLNDFLKSGRILNRLIFQVLFTIA